MPRNASLHQLSFRRAPFRCSISTACLLANASRNSLSKILASSGSIQLMLLRTMTLVLHWLSLNFVGLRCCPPLQKPMLPRGQDYMRPAVGTIYQLIERLFRGIINNRREVRTTRRPLLHRHRQSAYVSFSPPSLSLWIDGQDRRPFYYHGRWVSRRCTSRPNPYARAFPIESLPHRPSLSSHPG